RRGLRGDLGRVAVRRNTWDPSVSAGVFSAQGRIAGSGGVREADPGNCGGTVVSRTTGRRPERHAGASADAAGMDATTEPTVVGGAVADDTDLAAAAWHISSFSPDNGGSCVEAGPLLDGSGRVAVRHSHFPDGVVIVYTRAEWEAFVRGVRGG